MYLCLSNIFCGQDIVKISPWNKKWAQQNICSTCLKPAEEMIKCSKCKGVLYCGIACQSDGWIDHRGMCKLMEFNLQEMEETENSEDNIKFLQFDQNLYETENKDVMKELGITWFLYHNSCQHLYKQYHEIGLINSSKTALDLSRKYALKKMKAFCFKEDFPKDETSNDSASNQTRNDPIKEAFRNNDYGWNIIHSMIALGELQEAFNFIIQWMSFYSKRNESGFTSHYEHFLKWERKQYVEQNPSDFYDLPEDLSYQEPNISWKLSSSPNLLTIYFGLVLIKANVLHMTEEYLVKHDQFTAFMMGAHPRLGENSHIKQLKSISPIIQQIAQYVGVKKSKPTFLQGKNGRTVLKNNYDQITKYMKMIYQISVYGFESLMPNGFESLMPKNGSNTERRKVNFAGQFAKPVFEGLENKDKILRIARTIFIEGEISLRRSRLNITSRSNAVREYDREGDVSPWDKGDDWETHDWGPQDDWGAPNEWGAQNEWGPQDDWGPQDEWDAQDEWDPQNDWGAQDEWDPHDEWGTQDEWGPQDYWETEDEELPRSRSHSFSEFEKHESALRMREKFFCEGDAPLRSRSQSF